MRSTTLYAVQGTVQYSIVVEPKDKVHGFEIGEQYCILYYVYCTFLYCTVLYRLTVDLYLSPQVHPHILPPSAELNEL